MRVQRGDLVQVKGFAYKKIYDQPLATEPEDQGVWIEHSMPPPQEYLFILDVDLVKSPVTGKPLWRTFLLVKNQTYEFWSKLSPDHYFDIIQTVHSS